jgi:catechol 2,3-dioxygenase-like lactoylglutathione lyase family enzyme
MAQAYPAHGAFTTPVLSVRPASVGAMDTAVNPPAGPAPDPPGPAAARPLARLQVVALDCPDPHLLADFYARVLGAEVDRADDDWVQLRAGGGVAVAFQRVPDHRPPDWPGAEHPQQLHLDLEVDDLDAGEQAVVALGARRHPVQPGETFRVFLDPAGHPFCLVLPD